MATVTGTKRHLAIDTDTLNTGQGANELYDMDQNVLTTSGPTFASVAITNNVTVGGTVDGRDVAADGAKAATAHGWGNHASAGYATGDNFDNDGTFASLRAQGTTAGDVGLGNATNESKATMFAGPTFTGNAVAPTPSSNDNSTKIATTAYVQTELTDLIGGAPGTLDTLNELAAAIDDDASYASTLTTALATKLPKAGGTMSGAIAMGNNNITGVNNIQANGDVSLQTSTGEYALYGSANAQTQLYHNGIKKFETTSGGVDITGEVQGDTLDIDGNADISGNLTLSGTYPRILFTDSNSDDDYSIINDNGTFIVYNDTDSSTAFAIAGNNNATFAGDITVGGTVDGIDIATDVAANTAKTGITSGQASAITANTAKTGITSGQASAITSNSAKTGITSEQASAITANTSKVSFPGLGTTSTKALAGNTTTISSAQASAITANTAKTGITSGQASAITANTAKTGITSGQASAITANTAKTGITSEQASAITSNSNKTGITSGQASAITANTAKTGITSGQASAITANTAKRGISSEEQEAITANTSKTGITSGQASAITANTAKTGITSGQASAITANTAKRDARYIHYPVIANFNGNINSQQYVPLSDGETEGTSVTGRRDNFVAPCNGEIVKIIMRSNASLLSSGRGVTLTGKLHIIPDQASAIEGTATATTTTAATNYKNTLDFSEAEGRSFEAGDRLLVSLQAPLNASKNYYTTVVFKLDQSSF